MKVSYDILKKFVTPPREFIAKELAEVLTMSTVEVDDYISQAESLKGVVVGLVKEVKSHPKADKLKLATVDIGKKEMEVVCGGVNLRTGMKVAFATIGTSVRWHGQGDWVTLEKAVIRGVESSGMACAADELGLDDVNAVEHGIMDLSYLNVSPGVPLAEALGFSDIVLDIDNKSITHRPDLWGHLGLARELAALWRVKLAMPKLPDLKPEIDIPLMVTSKANKGLERYMAVAISGIKVVESPDWLKRALNALGMRPINNVVDITNYVMLEIGQPLHAFDIKKLASPEIVVRYAEKGEKLHMLDGVTRTLDTSTLLICDRKKPLAAAGVMGGEGSGVTANTETIVLESATFEPVGIRNTATRFGLRTEASARFEKALDPALAELALKRTVALIEEICPSARVSSPVVDVYSEPAPIKPIELSLPWLYKRLGTQIPEPEVKDILERLGFKVVGKGNMLAVTPPSWRATRDITIPEDLVEEVARIYGYGKIPLSLPKFEIIPPVRDEEQELRWKIRDILVGVGWVETLSYSFVGGSQILEIGHHLDDCLELVNPVDQTKKFLRPSILSTMYEQFEAAQRAEGSQNVKIFEFGRVFKNVDSGWPSDIIGKHELPYQSWHLLLAVYDQKYDPARIISGTIDVVFDVLDLERPKAVMYKFINNAVFAEIEIDDMTTKVERKLFKPIPKYPSITRDLSIIIRPDIKWEDIDKVVKGASGLIESIELFDVYQTKGSLAFRLVFRSSERTLKSAEVDEVVEKVIKLLQKKFGVTIRS